MARGSAGYAKSDSLRAVAKCDRLFWLCSASVTGDTLITADNVRNRGLIWGAAS